ATVVEVTPEAEQEWVDEMIDKARMGERFRAECTPGYYNNEGQPNPNAQQSAPYGGGSIRFFELLKQWREDGRFEGLKFSA
ncbi:MAG: hypothetical protein KDI31_15655, partial [Pseudomonadales bacterium]|nr:hypothetical protein [Pseudomonadales bacterium]